MVVSSATATAANTDPVQMQTWGDHVELGPYGPVPLGASLYPEPPYRFRDAEQVMICFTAQADVVRPLLPPGLRLADEPARCELRLCKYDWSAFGPYLETYLIVRVLDHRDDSYWYLPLIFTDNEAPMAAGREVWGYPKKLAQLRWSWTPRGTGGPVDDRLHFSVERPAGLTLLSATFAPERPAEPRERKGHPVLSLRYLPPSQAGRRPAACELITVASPKMLLTDAGGAPRLWEGRGSFTVLGRSDSDPWHLFEPIEITSAYWQVSDFSLPAGSLLHDYLRDQP